MTLREVAAQVGLSVPTVMAAHRGLRGRWLGGGQRQAAGRKRGEGRQLAPDQQAAIRRLICDKTPDQPKMGFALWNRQAMVQLVQDRRGVELPIRTVGEYLERWGFTPQKPIKKAYEQGPAEVRKWLDEVYPRIAARDKTEGTEIHWGDETGLR